MTVTAALDRIALENPLTEIGDLEYSGKVTYASGRSSMEITCQVAKAPPAGKAVQPSDVVLTFTTSMVSLDPATRKSTKIPALETTSPQEEVLFEEGKQRSAAKKIFLASSLLSTPPNDEESSMIHNIWLRQLAYHDPSDPSRMPTNVVSMAATRVQNASICHPLYRNRHQYMIFGGYLLKQTFELAFTCAASFAHARPTFLYADPCNFVNPVPVGSVLYLTATVVYTDPPLVDVDTKGNVLETAPSQPHTRVQVRVDSKVRDVEHGHAKPTGQFHYTFSVPKDCKILPSTYQDFMIYTDARRRVQRAKEDQVLRRAIKNAEKSGNVTE